MPDEPQQRRASELALLADRLDELADFADLMGDGDAGRRLRSESNHQREVAMTLLDH